MRCPRCGRNVPDYVPNCPNCGTAMSQDTALLNTGSNQQFQNYPYRQNNPIQQKHYPQPAYGLGLASMIVSICAFAFSLLILASWVFYIFAVPCGITGLVLGLVSLKQSMKINFKNTFAKVGSIIGLSFVGLSYLAGIVITVIFLAGLSIATRSIF